MIEQLLSFAIGAAAFGAGYLARARRRHAAPAAPMCACGHGLNFHDGQGSCHGVAGKTNKVYDHEGFTLLSYDPVSCTCQRYVGPEHIADVWVPPTSLPAREDKP